MSFPGSLVRHSLHCYGLTRILLATLALTSVQAATADTQTPSSLEQASAEELLLSATENEQVSEDNAYIQEMKAVWKSLDRQQGDITLPNNVASLHVPETFYYLNPADAEKILVDAWGNPPGAGARTLGMLFPAAGTPFDSDAWGVTITYEEDGHISDDNADEIDYNDLLADMKADTRSESKEREKQGYEPIELVGWAAAPYYDKTEHKLHWAQEIHFGDEQDNTLNYNIRILGRKGVLVLNFIAGMDQLQTIEMRMSDVLSIAEFNQGSRYDDFNPDIDEVAAYGIGALIAGKVIAKTGLLVTALLFLKKFGLLFLAGGGALLGRLFKSKNA
jgi:uncharacterized membrane-anchored protein